MWRGPLQEKGEGRRTARSTSTRRVTLPGRPGGGGCGRGQGAASQAPRRPSSQSSTAREERRGETHLPEGGLRRPRPREACGSPRPRRHRTRTRSSRRLRAALPAPSTAPRALAPPPSRPVAPARSRPTCSSGPLGAAGCERGGAEARPRGALVHPGARLQWPAAEPPAAPLPDLVRPLPPAASARAAPGPTRGRRARSAGARAARRPRPQPRARAGGARRCSRASCLRPRGPPAHGRLGLQVRTVWGLPGLGLPGGGSAVVFPSRSQGGTRRKPAGPGAVSRGRSPWCAVFLD